MPIERNASLRVHNTFGIDAKADVLARFGSADELRDLLRAEGIAGRPQLVLGGGSNLLFTGDYHGAVLLNEVKGLDIAREDEAHVWLRAGAGEYWHALVMHAVDHGWGGIENMSLIPGKVGAAPMQNIGAYGTELKDVFEELEAFNIASGAVERFDRAACAFGYRESFFKRAGKGKYIILSITVKLKKHATVNTSYGSIKVELEKRGISAPTIKDVSEAVIAIRRSKLPDPSVLGNAGSFFKNPVVPVEVAERLKAVLPDVVTFPAADGSVKLAAGQLIEKAGWKGYRDGPVGVHRDQALVLVNHGGATGAMIFDLSTRILASVQERFGLELEREVNII